MLPDSFALVGCTVSPGFHFDDFEMGEREKLISLYPQHKSIITKFTP
ncbi:MAG TPA: cupin domain-containing protein [Ignavibacteria bacterium]|nr:cupin domain-containing protein [Ignavibacteria bacterium]